MASLSLPSLLLAGACLVSSATAAIDKQLVGTWSTKSGKVITGPSENALATTKQDADCRLLDIGLLQPRKRQFYRAQSYWHFILLHGRWILRGGILQSHFKSYVEYEQTFYWQDKTNADDVSIAADPSCAQGIMQFQHGTVTMNTDLSLSFEPFKVDGRQLQSDPCTSDNGKFARYNQTETMAKWQVYIDPYSKRTRLDLYGFDGKVMNPMYLAYSPPVMLPTQTMNPTPEATASATGSAKKRDLGGSANEQIPIPLNKDSHIHATPAPLPLMHRVDLNVVWWSGIAMIVFGGTAYFL
ncbi:Protein rot1 [Lachnellula occidentalis]|uniref:Protein ROT1 n=1 Tax=Lachnellula occidentalis TaxID=215460 RepID=A0A8H8RQT6_9HELO|nr:Protein rot1 [Lachnellula occidentalis]